MSCNVHSQQCYNTKVISLFSYSLFSPLPSFHIECDTKTPCIWTTYRNIKLLPPAVSVCRLLEQLSKNVKWKDVWYSSHKQKNGAFECRWKASNSGPVWKNNVETSWHRIRSIKKNLETNNRQFQYYKINSKTCKFTTPE